jgi:ADP-ribose pyrophosphatase YjhB (NUDIX family)
MVEERFQIGVKALVKDTSGNILVCRTSGADEHEERHDKWDMPGGRIEKGEMIDEALRRELKEELRITDIKVEGLHEAVISKVRISSGNETYGLCLLVYNCKLPTQELGLGKGSEEYKWASKTEIKGLLSHKYPGKFLDAL